MADEKWITVRELKDKLQQIVDDGKGEIPIMFSIVDGEYDSRAERQVNKNIQTIKGVEVTMHNETWEPIQLVIKL